MPTFSDAMASIAATSSLGQALRKLLAGFELSTDGKSEKDADESKVEMHLQNWAKEPAHGLKPELAVAKADSQVGAQAEGGEAEGEAGRCCFLHSPRREVQERAAVRASGREATAGERDPGAAAAAGDRGAEDRRPRLRVS